MALYVQYLCFEVCVCVCFCSEDKATCEFWVEWETRAACEMKQHEVEIENGTIKVPETGAIVSLGALYFRSLLLITAS